MTHPHPPASPQATPGLNLSPEDFAWITAQVLSVARICCPGRVVSVLEGGYDLDALASSTAAHVAVLMAA